MLIHAHFSVVFRILTSKVGHGGLVLVCNQGPLVDLCMQDYKSLGAAVTTCAFLVNIQIHTDRQTDRQFLTGLLAYLIRSAR